MKMMPLKTFFARIFFMVALLHLCCGLPLSNGYSDFPDPFSSVPNHALFLISGAAIILLIYATTACVCCPNKNIKALTYQNGFAVNGLNENNSLQFENPTEFAIFPPHSTIIDLQPVGLSFPECEEKITFEPLPDILPRKTNGPLTCSSRPAHFRALLKHKMSLQDWFDDPNVNFPRDQLQYISEIGNGWFGRVVEGDASHICNTEEKTRIIVKILREEASPSDHVYFLHEVRPYRDLFHPNVIRLLGRCLESDPFLLIMEHSINDLKSFLLQQDDKESLMNNGILLRMAYNIAAGLKHLHKNDFIHVDLAAHNCFVCSDLTVKVGDYGISFDRHREDYYCLGDIALPLRWYSPETVLCTDSTVETKEINKEANVWAFGVVLWEIFEFGKLPYEELTNEEVLQKVLIEKTVKLPPFTLAYPMKEELLLIMEECWKTAPARPSMNKVENFLIQLYNGRHNLKTLESFEERWNSLQPKSNDSSVKYDYHNCSSDGENFPSFETSCEIFDRKIDNQLSPSLRVLNGSIDELTENDTCLNSVSLDCEKSSADVVSVTSDKDLSLGDDIGANELVKPASMNVDNINPAKSRESSEESALECLQGLSNLNHVERLILDTENSFSKSGESLSNSSTSKNLKADNELIYLDSNSNELDYLSQRNVFCTEENMDKSPNQHNNIKTGHKLYKNDKKEAVDSHINSSVLNKLTTFSKVPDIVIHEAALNTENTTIEDEVSYEKESSISCSKIKTRPFRFVFPPDSEPNQACSVLTEVAESVNYKSSTIDNSSQPSANTPLKNHEGSDLCLSQNSLPEETVFFSCFSDEINLAQESNKQLEDDKVSCIKSEQSAVSLDEIFYDTTSNIKSGMPFEDFSDFDVKPNDYNAIQTVNEENCNGISKTIVLGNVSDSVNNKLVADVSCAAKIASICAFDEGASKCPDINLLNDNKFVSYKLSENVPVHLSPCCENPSTAEMSTDTSSSNCTNADEEFLGDTESKEHENKREIAAMPSPNFEHSSTPDYTLNSSYSLNDYKYSSAESTPFSFSESYSNAKVEPDRQAYQSDSKKFCESSNEHLPQAGADNQGLEQMENIKSGNFRSDNLDYDQKVRVQFDGNLRNKSNSVLMNYTAQSNIDSLNADLLDDFESEKNTCKSKAKLSLFPYEEVVVEDLETGEQTIVSENFSICDDYEDSGESDEILKIDTETDEAIIVDSSEALLGFVPSRSIEMLQECEILPTLDFAYSVAEDKKSLTDENHQSFEIINNISPVLKHAHGPSDSPDSSFALHQPFRNFCLQNEVIEEEITEEITSPSSSHSTASFSSNEIFSNGEEKMSQSSESYHQMMGAFETPVMNHFYSESDDGSKTDISNSGSEISSGVINANYATDVENNLLFKEEADVMHSWQPTQSIRWNSDETLEVEEDNSNPVIIEGQEILAGSNEITIEDITTALTHLNCKVMDHLNVSQTPSPYSSVESSPCRDGMYTPDFESESDETGSGSSSCSSTSGSFECIHNKFKNMTDVSKLLDDSEDSISSREQSPIKVFSNTWNCHATPTKSVLVTPEKKFNSMRKSVSFHEEDPQVVFEYPPAPYSSEEEEERYMTCVVSSDIDYGKYADWELQAGDNDEIDDTEDVLKIEELDSEPYVRRPIFPSSSLGPLNRPMIYSLTSDFSDDDFDFTEINAAPSNSPEEGASRFQMNDLISSQLESLSKVESRSEHEQDSGQPKSFLNMFPASVQESGKENFNFLPDFESDAVPMKPNLIDNENVKEAKILSVQESLSKENEIQPAYPKSNNKLKSDGLIHDEICLTNLPENLLDHGFKDAYFFTENNSIQNLIITEAHPRKEDGERAMSFDKLSETFGDSERKELSKHPQIVMKSSDPKHLCHAEDFCCTNGHIVDSSTDLKQEITNIIFSEINMERKLDEISVSEDNMLDKIPDFSSSLKNVFNNNNELENTLIDTINTMDSLDGCIHKKPSDSMDSNATSFITLTSTAATEKKTLNDITEFSSRESLEHSLDSNESKEIVKNHCEMLEEFENSDYSIQSTKVNSNNCSKISAFVHESEECSSINGCSVNTFINPKLDNGSHEKTIYFQENCPTEKTVTVPPLHMDLISGTTLADNQTQLSGTEITPNSISWETEKENICSDISQSEWKNTSDSKFVSNSFCQLVKNFENSSSMEGKKQESALHSKSGESSEVSLALSSVEVQDLVPKIVITPASESEVEDELEELGFAHADDIDTDFSVIPQYTNQPFNDDLYHRSRNTDTYVEAFNFEFDSGDFFEDLYDYPCNESNSHVACFMDKELSSTGMIEKSPDIEHLLLDSSPSSKDTTHL